MERVGHRDRSGRGWSQDQGALLLAAASRLGRPTWGGLGREAVYGAANEGLGVGMEVRGASKEGQDHVGLAQPEGVESGRK